MSSPNPSTPRQFSVRSGITLQSDTYGSPSSPPVILAHGGGQTRHAWRNTGRLLAEAGFYSICLDLRGHGSSDWCPKGDYRVEAFANDLVDISGQLATQPILIGASLGGIAAMIAGGEVNTRLFKSVIFVDITPHMEMDGVEKIVGFMKEHLEEGFSSLEDAAEAIGRYMPNRPSPSNLDGLRKNLREIDGRYFWHWDPKFVNGVQRPSASRDPERLARAVKQIEAPILLVRGRMSELVSTACVDQFLELVPDAQFIDVENAGHMVAGDRNDIFTEAILGFLA